MEEDISVIPSGTIESKIMLLRGQKVMLDSDLADLYRVTTGALNRQVRRNLERFPEDFMFQLDREESDSQLRSRCQIGILKRGQNIKYFPRVFTEQGVAMLSSVLRSRRAAQVNVEIMRAFVRLRQWLASNTELARKLADLEKKYDSQFKIVFDTIHELMKPPTPQRKRIGFHGDA
jgi:hypothetical protein